MLDIITRVLISLLLLASASLFMYAWIVWRRANSMLVKATQRKAETRRGLAKQGLLDDAYQQGQRSRDEEMKWYALCVDGYKERLAEIDAEKDGAEATAASAEKGLR